MVGESGLIQHREHEFSRSIARERASGAVGAVRARSQTHNKDASVGIAETGHGLAPVFAVAVSAALFAGNLLTVLDQARTSCAGDDLMVENSEPVRVGLWTSFPCQAGLPRLLSLSKFDDAGKYPGRAIVDK